MDYHPHEFEIGGVYMLPLLLAFIIAVLLAIRIAKLLNRYGLSKHLFYPPIFFLAMVVIFTILIEKILFLF